MSHAFDLTSTPIEDGVTLIEASAGTGKTYCLTGLVLRLLLEGHVKDASELLVVTFTQAATQELIDRIRSALRDTIRAMQGEAAEDPFIRHLTEFYRNDATKHRLLSEALVRFDDLTVSTIHGFCKRVLDETAFESGSPFELDLLENDAPMLRDAARDIWRRLLYPVNETVAAVAVEEGWTPETFLPDFEVWRRHPQTEIKPGSAPLESAIARLQETHRDLGKIFDVEALFQLLSRRKFRAHSYFAKGPLKERLQIADAFCKNGQPAGVRALKELAGPRLGTTLFKRDQAGVLQHPIIASTTSFAAAISDLHHALRCRFIEDLHLLFESQKRRALVLTYDDLLRRVRQALAEPQRGPALARAIRRRYRVALIDEFQDTDLVQYDIFRRVFSGGPLFLIGDPKQAIYRFRGADVFAYLAAKEDADRAYTLERNWRSAKPLVEAVNAIFSNAQKPFVFDPIAFEPATAAAPHALLTGVDHPPLQWIWIPRLRSRQEAKAAIDRVITAEVVRLLASDVRLDDLIRREGVRV